MSNEVILNLSFDNQTVTDLTGNWTLDGTPNATYEQIEGRDGYSIVEGSLGRCIVLNAVDQNARYDEYTVDFDMFVKPTYTSDYYIYNVFYLWSRKNPHIVGQFEGEIGEVLSVSLRIGGSERIGTTNYSPIGRWVHVTFTSGPTGEDNLYHTAVYVDGVKLVERTDSGSAYYGNPFGISQRIIPCARDPGSFLMPNGPGVCLNTYKIVAGIHAPNQKPAISLLNLSRVFNNFCTWLKRQLSTVAFTGSYNDLSNKPTISTVNDGTLTIQQNGTNVQTFTANASTNKTANIQCVDLSSNQTISGVKTFSDGLFASKSGQGDLATLEDSSINSTNEDANGMPLTGHTNSVKIKGLQVNVIPCMLTGKLHTNGNTEAGLYAYKYKDLTANASLSLRYNYNGNYGTATFDNINSIIPGTTNTTNLGVSALQWNKLYARNILIDNDINIASSLINKTSNSGMLSIRSALTNQDGASIALYSKDYSGGSSFVGNISMTAYGNSDYTIFRIYPNGAMSVYNNSAATTKIVAMQEDVVPRSGGAVMTGNALSRAINYDEFRLDGGTTWNDGASLSLSGKNRANGNGHIILFVADGSNMKEMRLRPDGTWTWEGQAVQISSDQRLKQQITEIDDKLLDAWEDVNLVQFKYNDAVKEKSDNARLHTGFIVQQIDEACKSHGVDVSKYGLYCHEVYQEETREVEQADGTKKTEVVRPANEHYSLRYTEALIVECAYLRKCIKELRTEIEELSSK